MPEFNSRQSPAANSGKALQTAQGKTRKVRIQTPATAAWAVNDTIASGVKVPAGSIFTIGSVLVNTAFGTTAAVDIGLRNFDTKAVIDQDGIGAAVAVATAAAGGTNVRNGAYVQNATVLDQDAEVYVTIVSGTLTANAQLLADIEYVSYD